MLQSNSVRFAALLAGAASVATPAMGKDMAPRDYLPSDIVVTAAHEGYSVDDGSSATKTPTPLIDVAQAMQVITSDQLEDQAVTQLGEALRYVPGISIESGEGHRDAIFIRGQSTTADFFLDGIRDDAQYYRSLYNVERMEVLKGPNALIFGRGGGGGAINRVSKTADAMDMFTRVAGSVGSFGQFSLSADVNQPLSDNVSARINATYEDFESNRDYYGGRFIGISPTISAWIGAETKLTASYTYDDDSRVTDRGLPSFEGAPLYGYDDTLFGDPDYNDSFSRTHIGRVRLDHRFSDRVTLNATLLYADYDKFYANIVPNSGVTNSNVTLVGYESATQRQNLIGQVNLVADLNTGPIEHTLLLGGEFGEQRTDSTRLQALFDDGMGGTSASVTVPLAETIFVPAFTIVPQRASASDLNTASVYVQDQIDFGLVQLVGGVRYDRFDLNTDNLAGFAAARVDEGWSPRFGVIVKPTEVLSLYASYSESFLPQSGDQFSLLEPVAAGLDPEKFENYEIGAKWAPRPELLVSAALFRLDRSNSLAPDPANPGFVILSGETRVEGVELNLAGELAPNLHVNLSYTYLDGKVTQTTSRAAAGTRLQQLPESQIGAWARYDVAPKLGFGAGVIHQSGQLASLSGNVVLPAYTRVDAAIYYDVSPDFAVQINVENLLDENYYPSAHGDNNIQPGKPLGVSLSARLKI